MQNKTNGKIVYSRNVAETDHIFLRANHLDRPLIDDIGNFWFLPQHVNRSKTNAKPATYLAQVDDTVLKEALIGRANLIKPFATFVKARRKAVIETLQERTGISSL